MQGGAPALMPAPESLLALVLARVQVLVVLLLPRLGSPAVSALQLLLLMKAPLPLLMVRQHRHSALQHCLSALRFH